MRYRSPLAAIAVAGLAVAVTVGLSAGSTANAAAVAASAGTAASGGTAGCGQAPALASGTHTIQSSGQTRSYILELPSDYNSSHPYRLIFGFHWLNGTAQDVDSGDQFGAAWSYYGLRAQAGDTTIFVAPQGINNGWANTNGEDLTFVQDMLNLFETGLCIDPSEIFAMGWSYGGAMTYAVACNMPTVFRAVAVYSGADLSGCSPGTQPVPYLGFHGGSDNVLPIADGEGLLNTFVKNNGCTPQNPVVPTPGSLTHIVTTYSGCRPGYPVIFAAFDGGHTPDPVDGSAASNGDTTWTKTLTWDFFTQFPSTIPTPPVTLAASYNNVGITADSDTAPGNYDGNGASFSETALTNAHAAPGATVTSSGVTFTFPDVAAGANDNAVAEGQTIEMSGSGTLGFLLSASYGPATGSGIITYTDGTTQAYTLSSSDWWSTTPQADEALAVSSAYQNRQGNTTNSTPGNIFSEAVPLTAGKTVSTVTLPSGPAAASGSPALHVFAMATTTATQGNTVTVVSPGNQSGTVGTAAKVQVQASDSAPGQTLAYAATGLPPGLSISSSTGLISGTPTTAGTSDVTVTVTDGTGVSGSAAFTWTVNLVRGSTCQVTYTPDQWQGGFTANITITNTGTTPVNGWTLGFTFGGDQHITSAWNGTLSQSGQNVSIASASYNADIAPSASTSLGFQGTWTASDAPPAAFTLNGTPCTT